MKLSIDENGLIDISTVTRIEVIDYEMGRTYSRRPCKVKLSLQDNNRTLKIFVDSEENL